MQKMKLSLMKQMKHLILYQKNFQKNLQKNLSFPFFVSPFPFGTGLVVRFVESVSLLAMSQG